MGEMHHACGDEELAFAYGAVCSKYCHCLTARPAPPLASPVMCSRCGPNRSPTAPTRGKPYLVTFSFAFEEVGGLSLVSDAAATALPGGCLVSATCRRPPAPTPRSLFRPKFVLKFLPNFAVLLVILFHC